MKKLLMLVLLLVMNSTAKAEFIYPDGIMDGESLSLAKSSGDIWRTAHRVLLTERMRVPPSVEEIAAIIATAPFCSANFANGTINITGITSLGERIPFPPMLLTGGAFQQKFLDLNQEARVEWKCSVPAELWGGGSIYRNFRFKEGGIMMVSVNAKPYRGMKGPLNSFTTLR